MEGISSVLADLARDLPQQLRFQRLLINIRRAIGCDAVALLKLERDLLRPIAADGLMRDALGRRFLLAEHPRLNTIVFSRDPVVFPADSDLPDPYDGLLAATQGDLPVHDCAGATLYVDGQPWGILTLDALQAGRIAGLDDAKLRTLVALAEASIKADLSATRLTDALSAAGSNVQGEEAFAPGAPELIGESPAMQALKGDVATVAASELAVLILGETGVGKELVAKQLHRQSARRNEPLVYVNCAALPESIAESELFGHVKGAFSGAIAERRGRFEQAHRGTLFLDEIGELAPSIQAKLLRVLQSGEIQRVGSDDHLQVDVRVIAATNREVKEEVAAGRFRADLYHRLSVYPISVPPLRERGQDVLVLAGYFLERNRARLGLRSLRLAPAAESALLAYRWPGNVRELEHAISRAALKAISAGMMTAQRMITITPRFLDLDLPFDMPVAAQVAPSAGAVLTLRQATEQFQHERIRAAIDAYPGNMAAAARALGLDRSNLLKLVKRLGIRAAEAAGRLNRSASRRRAHDDGKPV